MTDIRFIEKFEENVRLYPDKVILQDQEASLTFKQLDELSGRVYAYLKQKGIGREDFVMIDLPHDIVALACMVGVWKAGAALVFCDDYFPKERKSYIYQTCSCKLTIDTNRLQEIKENEPLKGHQETSQHDAAFAVFTSGSEGKPKGVIQEYGKLAFTPMSLLEASKIHCPTDMTLFVYAPLSTVATINTANLAMINPFTLDIGSLDLMKHPQRLNDYLIERKVTMASLTPSFYKYSQLKSPHLTCVHLSSEPVHGVFNDDVTLVNLYMQSEGYCITAFNIDKPYRIAPIGKPAEADMVRLYEDDKPVSAGHIGELCYRNPYFRGYINDEATAQESFVDGYFRSGDIAKLDENGNYVILGRKTDMIKINGNRIEPAEIEAAVKRVLGIDWAFAKGFVQTERSFICVYYTAEIEIDLAKVRKELMLILPSYMIPSYFIHLDDIPRLPNGKVNRQALLAPDIRDYTAEYVAPTNELEELLCNVMRYVLGVERIGINDDFYLLGGDSLRTIRLIAECHIEGLSVSEVYAHRTPAKIAEAWLLNQLK